MHEAMYRHPAVMKNLEALRAMGVTLIDPSIEEGKAKIADTCRWCWRWRGCWGPRTWRVREFSSPAAPMPRL